VTERDIALLREHAGADVSSAGREIHVSGCERLRELVCQRTGLSK
jgi:hypothetical protein